MGKGIGRGERKGREREFKGRDGKREREGKGYRKRERGKEGKG